MGIPMVLVSAATCGSLVTAIKSGWELSRMLRQKRDQKRVEDEADWVYRGLRRALHSGRMDKKEFDRWLEKLLVAEEQKSLASLRKIRVHLHILKENSERRTRCQVSRTRSNEKRAVGGRRSRSKSSTSKPYRNEPVDGIPQESVRFDMRHVHYVPDPPQRYEDFDWPQSAGSIECFHVKDDGSSQAASRVKTREAVVTDAVPQARLQRRTTGTYQSPGGRQKPSTRRSKSSARDDEERRGRPRRREIRDRVANGRSELSDDSFLERLGYRSRR